MADLVSTLTTPNQVSDLVLRTVLTEQELQAYKYYKQYINKNYVQQCINEFLHTIPARYKALLPLPASKGGMWGAFLELLTIANIKHVSFRIHQEGNGQTPSEVYSTVGDPRDQPIHLWLTGENEGCGHYSLLIPEANTYKIIAISANGDCLFDAAIRGIKNLSSPSLTLPTASSVEEIATLRHEIAAVIDESSILVQFQGIIFPNASEHTKESILSLPTSVLIKEAIEWREKLSFAIYFANKLRQFAKVGNLAGVKILLTLGIDVNDQVDYFTEEKYNNKNTALHEAIIAYAASSSPSQRNTYTEIIKLLRQYGAKDDLTNCDNLTARILAESLGIDDYLDITSTTQRRFAP